MDVDSIEVNALSEKERKELMQQGACFTCKQQGHMSKACPKRGQYKKPQNDGPHQTMAVWTTEPENVSGDFESLG
jgi:Zinc knuckle